MVELLVVNEIVEVAVELLVDVVDVELVVVLVLDVVVQVMQPLQYQFGQAAIHPPAIVSQSC